MNTPRLRTTRFLGVYREFHARTQRDHWKFRLVLRDHRTTFYSDPYDTAEEAEGFRDLCLHHLFEAKLKEPFLRHPFINQERLNSWLQQKIDPGPKFWAFVKRHEPLATATLMTHLTRTPESAVDEFSNEPDISKMTQAEIDALCAEHARIVAAFKAQNHDNVKTVKPEGEYSDEAPKTN